jgi:hypothetical protein
MTLNNISTLRPGLLVSLKTSVQGNVKYSKTVLESEHKDPDGAERARWETERTITDKVEHEAAQEARGKASHVIRRVCTNSAFGLLCPESKTAELEAAIADARKVAEDFNSKATLTRLGVFVICGRVAQDDVEAVRAINSEIRDLLADMETGLANLDVKMVRAAAVKAKGIGQMLSPSAAEKIEVAITAARASARKIVAAGEQVAAEVDRATIRRIAEQRTAFLDIDNMKEVARPSETGRAIDLDIVA